MNKNIIRFLIVAALSLAILAGGIGYNSYIQAHTFTLSGDEQIQPVSGTVKVIGPRDTEVIFVDVKTGENYAIPYFNNDENGSIKLEKGRWYTVEDGAGLTIRPVNVRIE